MITRITGGLAILLLATRLAGVPVADIAQPPTNAVVKAQSPGAAAVPTNAAMVKTPAVVTAPVTNQAATNAPKPATNKPGTNAPPSTNLVPANILPPGAAATMNQATVSAAGKLVTSSKRGVTATPTVNLSGKPVPTASVSVAWNDETLSGPAVTGYKFYWGTTGGGASNLITLTNGQWLATNGLAEITLTNVLTTVQYSCAIEATGPNGDSAVTAFVSFIAQNYVLPTLILVTNGTGTNATVSATGINFAFMTFTNHAYWLQCAASLKGPWTNQVMHTNSYGVVSVTEPVQGSSLFGRLEIR